MREFFTAGIALDGSIWVQRHPVPDEAIEITPAKREKLRKALESGDTSALAQDDAKRVQVMSAQVRTMLREALADGR